ncbi:hydrolase 2, exosortase A system-associated [Denitromonas ohlonensis]|uniref:hydrolase 2, exosortase A system-associated n=1 Tax=Denitromonas ohlonensis TaxID=3078508 RepID=UPI0016435F45|nr:hydrolase 2, exosortase A system-associated [Denitromonas ohlonensis]
MTTQSREAFFLPGPFDPGRFCLLQIPSEALKGCVLFVPAFAEEMNKSRRMVALAADYFAANGWASMLLDPSGCGDSGGDFSDAEWLGWQDDIDAAYTWLSERFGVTPVLWSMRAGCLLVTDWLRSRQIDVPTLFWQPVIHGKQHLTQFLFLKAAGEMLGDSDGRAVMARTRQDLASGCSVEIAGYTLSPYLAEGLEAASLEAFPSLKSTTTVIEVLASEGVSGPNSIALQQKWSAMSIPYAWATVTGPAFWRTQEISVALSLPVVSLDALNGGVGEL